MEVADRIRAHGDHLTGAERRVAEAILAAPHRIAFGTVAELAERAAAGTSSVIRLAAKLGFDGYSDLQDCVQQDLASQLRPAAERIHEDRDDAQAAHIEAEIANVSSTLEGVDQDALTMVTGRLARLDAPLVVVSGTASSGVVSQFVADLGQLRPDVQVLSGSPISVTRDISLLPSNAVAIVVDLRRYEAWVLDAHRQLGERGIWSIGVTDSLLSPIAQRADVALVVSARAVGPFDSHVGTLALLNLIVAGVATRLQSSAAARLSLVEAAWNATGVLADEQ